VASSAPALLAALAFFWLAWRWQRAGRKGDLAGAFALYLLSVFLHSGTAAIALFPVAFALLYDGERVSAGAAALAAAAMAIAGWLLDRRFVVAPYEAWASDFPVGGSAPAGRLADAVLDLFAGLPPIAWLLLPIGFLVGVHWARAAGVPGTGDARARPAIVALLAGAAGAAGFGGVPVAAATLVAAALLLDARGAPPWWRPRWLVALAAGSALGTVARLTLGEVAPAELLRTPFPYLPFLGTLMPALVALFAACATWLALVPPRDGVDDRPIRAAVLFVLAYCLALGFAMRYAPWRYLLIVYPWVLIPVAWGVREVVGAIGRRRGRQAEVGAWTFVASAVLAGAIGGHGIPASLRVVGASHGSVVPWNDPDLRVRPDHRSLGRFVRGHARAGDRIIAEDALEQRWYAGRVDEWFRSREDAGRYLYRDEEGIQRDIYVAARLRAEPPDTTVASEEDAAIWLITSGETADARGWYLTPEQRDWLERVEASRPPAHRGEDGLGAVYCFGRCP
jgi:hypothetical protein